MLNICPLRPTEIKQTCPEDSKGQTEITGSHQKQRTKVKKRFSEAYGSKLIFKMQTEVKQRSLEANRDQAEVTRGQQRSSRGH
jgi:hypothetical protein